MVAAAGAVPGVSRACSLCAWAVELGRRGLRCSLATVGFLYNEMQTFSKRIVIKVVKRSGETANPSGFEIVQRSLTCCNAHAFTCLKMNQ